MPLATGIRIGPYEITGTLGAGGMGEVYRARDTKLGRDVALKVISDAFALDPDRLARFRREAQVLASLNHPHIGAIYGFEDGGETHALVLELVEGDTLADRIARGPLPFDEALPIARQIAEALEAAHEQGIIHRDLKPANIKVTPDGVVKVLDFGLAKLTGPPKGGRYVRGEPDPDGRGVRLQPDLLPTITSPAMMTGVGAILGTAAYMSPEQAKGREADKRSDVWAFGCVLFEMLSGRRAFGGDDVADTLAAVLRAEPDWKVLPRAVPAHVRSVLARCLEKNRQARFADISTVRFLLDEGAAFAAGSSAASRSTLPWAAAGALGVGLALVLALWAPWREAPPSAVQRLEVGIGADASLVAINGAAAILSPDGQTLAFVAQKSGAADAQLFVRRLEQLQATPLSGTDGASSPFFSPDGQRIAFFANGKLKRISATGGAAVILCDAANGRGGSWGEDGTIVFEPNSAPGTMLMRVSEAGGKPEPFTTLAEGEATQRYPQVLPGGKAVLYMSRNSTGGNYDDGNLVVQPLPAGARKVVQRGAYYGRYVPSGHLVYMHDGTLFAAPFDLDRLEVTGEAVPVLEGVAGGLGGGAQFAVSASGTLVYLPGQSIGSDAPMLWVDRIGTTTPLRAMPADWSNPHFAPDGRRLAVDIGAGGSADIWVYEWARDTLTQLTFDAAIDLKPVWTPDGRRIAFRSNRGDNSGVNLYWQRADGTGEVQRLTESPNTQFPASWHPSGKFLAFHEINAQTGNDLMILPIEGDEASGWKPGKPTVFLNSPFAEAEPMFSPDGRWLAYMSNESGSSEVYVRPFPGPGRGWLVSTGGGSWPTWSRTRHELFYAAPDLRIMVATYAVEGGSFRADKPRLWTETRYTPRPRQRSFDLHPDGDRFAFASAQETPAAAKQDKVVFIFNFFDELRRLAPTKQ